MDLNNLAVITGFMGTEAILLQDKHKKLFMAFTISSTKKKHLAHGDLNDSLPIWHTIEAHKPEHRQLIQSLRKGSFVRVVGSIEYEPISNAKNKSHKRDATIIAHEIEDASYLGDQNQSSNQITIKIPQT